MLSSVFTLKITHYMIIKKSLTSMKGDCQNLSLENNQNTNFCRIVNNGIIFLSKDSVQCTLVYSAHQWLHCSNSKRFISCPIGLRQVLRSNDVTDSLACSFPYSSVLLYALSWRCRVPGATLVVQETQLFLNYGLSIPA